MKNSKIKKMRNEIELEYAAIDLFNKKIEVAMLMRELRTKKGQYFSMKQIRGILGF